MKARSAESDRNGRPPFSPDLPARQGQPKKAPPQSAGGKGRKAKGKEWERAG
jgi:hypothetical protein